MYLKYALYFYRSFEIKLIWTFDTEFPTIFNKTCKYITHRPITLNVAVKHRQLSYGYPQGHLAEVTAILKCPQTKMIMFTIVIPSRAGFHTSYLVNSYVDLGLLYVNPKMPWIGSTKI